MDTGTGADLAEIFDQVPSIAAGRLSVTELPGGLTNRNFKIIKGNATYVARVASGGSELLAIDREHEYRNSRRAAAAGVGAPVIEYAPGVRVLVIGFIEGRTLTNADVADPVNLRRIARACRALHSAERFDGDFNMFEIQRRYRAVAADRGFKIPDGYDELGGAFAAAEQALKYSAAKSGAEGTVPCNNDLLAANFIDDGDKIWLIDYEYSGNNDACFELGNIWAESHLSDDALAELVTEYYGRPLRNKIARARLLGLVGKYGWTLWGAIQAAVSPIDFDFWAWGMERFDGAVEGLAGPGFGKLLDEVQRDD
ncbi:MAG TPA: choline/ethanolamine kinase family protein [Streptosporangiaceae bacterium]|nr:choline/ethanolamine kinase family protein [Streptosporangiaceae bacterium]